LHLSQYYANVYIGMANIETPPNPEQDQQYIGRVFDRISNFIIQDGKGWSDDLQTTLRDHLAANAGSVPELSLPALFMLSDVVTGEAVRAYAPKAAIDLGLAPEDSITFGYTPPCRLEGADDEEPPQIVMVVQGLLTMDTYTIDKTGPDSYEAHYSSALELNKEVFMGGLRKHSPAAMMLEAMFRGDTLPGDETIRSDHGVVGKNESEQIAGHAGVGQELNSDDVADISMVFDLIDPRHRL
jgi:hypothetical protein